MSNVASSPATTTLLVVRRLGVAVASCLLGITLLAAALTRQLSCSMRDPTAVAETFASEEIIDRGYDVLLPAALHDRFGRDAPEATPLVLRDVIERVWPRGVARSQVEQLLAATWAGIVSDEPPAMVRMGPSSAGWSELPPALGQALHDHALAQQLVDRHVAPRLRERSTDVLGSVLGISLSAAESRAAAQKLLPPSWIRAHAVEATAAMVPYLQGSAAEFEARFELISRVPVARDLLYERLVEARAARRLARDHLLDPFLERAVARAGALPLGITISAAEIENTIFGSIPAGWFSRKSWVVLDAFSRYLTGESDGIAFEIPLAERNAAFGRSLVDLVRAKLAERLDGLSACTRTRLLPAIRALRRAELPDCVPGTQSLVEELAEPHIEAEVARLVEKLPAQLSLDHAEVTAKLGHGRMEAIDSARRRIREGMRWTEQDLERIAGAGSGDDDTALAVVRRGTVQAPDVQVVVEGVDARTRSLVELGRGAIRRPWALELAALAWLGVVAWVVGGDPLRRLRRTCWALSIVAAVAAVSVVATNWPTPADVAVAELVDAQAWPRLSSAARDALLPDAVVAWTRGLRMNVAYSLLPWAILGPLVHGLLALRSARARRGDVGMGQQAEPGGEVERDDEGQRDEEHLSGPIVPGHETEPERAERGAADQDVRQPSQRGRDRVDAIDDHATQQHGNRGTDREADDR